MKNRIEYALFVAFSLAFRAVGLWAARRLATPLGLFFYYLVPIRKEVTLKNLKIAFPDLSERERRRLARAAYRNFAVVLVEILSIPSISKERMLRAARIDGAPLVEEKLREGKGVVFLTAHFGNWEFAGMSASLQMTSALRSVVKPLRNPYVDRWMNAARGKWNQRTIRLGVSIRNVYQALREGAAVALVGDQRGPKGADRVDFFGKSSAVYQGVSALAAKTGAPIIMGFPVRRPDYDYDVVFEELDVSGLPEDLEERTRELTRRHTARLEEIIRRHPDHWFWMHDRWKN